MKKLLFIIACFLMASCVLAQTNDGQFGIIDQLPLNQPSSTHTKTIVSSINLTGDFNDLVIVVGFSDKSHNYPTINNNNYYPLLGAFPDGTLLKDYVAQHEGSIPADEWLQPAYNFNFVKSASNDGTYLSNHPFSYWVSQNGGSESNVIYSKYHEILKAIADQLYYSNPNIFNNVACLHFVFVSVTNCEFIRFGNTCSGGTIVHNFSLTSEDGSTTYWSGPITLQRKMDNVILHERFHIIGEISNQPDGFNGFPDRGIDVSPGEGYHNLNGPYDIMYHDGDNLPPLHSIYGEIPLTSQDLIFLGWIQQDEIETINSSNFTNYSDIKLADWSDTLTPTKISEGYRRIVKVMIHENYDDNGHNEYFLVEYHDASGLDKAFENYAEYPFTGYNKGVLIWHIKEKADMINLYSDNIMRLVAAVPYNGWYGNPIPDNQYRTDYVRSPHYNGVNSGEYDYMDDALTNLSTHQYLHMQDGGKHIWETTVVNDPNNTYDWDPTGQRLFFRLESLSSDFFSDQNIKGHVTDKITDATRPSTKDWGGYYNGITFRDPIKTHIAITNITSRNGYMTVRVYYNYWTGNITENSTMSGNVIVGGNVTVAPGVTLIIKPDTKLSFNSGCSIKVSGTLNVQGTSEEPVTFTSSNATPNIGDWYGIVIDAASNVNIAHANIEYATYGLQFINGASGIVSNCSITNNYYGIYANSSEPLISNNTISNNSYGVRINFAYAPNWDKVDILNNTIADNQYYGVYIYDSSPHLYNNNIDRNGRGVVLWQNSSPIFDHNTISRSNYYGLAAYGSSTPSLYYADGKRKGGYNTFSRNGTDGVYAGGSSNPNLGGNSTELGGYNVFEDNTAYEINNNNSPLEKKILINAMYNWWGQASGPLKTDFFGNVAYVPYLTSNPSANGNITSGAVVLKNGFGNSPSSSIPKALLVALHKQMRGKFKQSAQQFRSFILRNNSSPFLGFAVQQFIKSAKHYLRPKGVNNFITALLNRNISNEVKVELLRNQITFLIYQENYTEANTRIDYSFAYTVANSNAYFSFLFQKAKLNILFLNDLTTGITLLNKIIAEATVESEYYQAAELEIANLQLNGQLPKIISENNKSIVVKKYKLNQNYPNPFNPTTTINYTIPQDGTVTLKIYNVLGSEVMTLVNETQAEGKYQVTFDASHLSSGVYIYRIQSGSFFSSKKMIVLK